MKQRKKKVLFTVIGLAAVILIWAVWFYDPVPAPKFEQEKTAEIKVEAELWGQDRGELSGEQKKQVLAWYEGLTFQRRLFMPYNLGREGRVRTEVRIRQYGPNGIWINDITIYLWKNTENECEVVIRSPGASDRRYLILKGPEAIENFLGILK